MRSPLNKLTIFDESANKISSFSSNAEIKEQLNAVGVRFEQWTKENTLSPSSSNDDILQTYDEEIKKLVHENGYQTWDVISLNSDHPDKDSLRKKFITEHTHSEDEVRFFVRGSGLFTLHIKDKVYSVLCEKDDLISVPKGTPHWFDMGSKPEFTCIRLFNNPEGWIAQYTESGIDQKFIKKD